MVNITIKSLWIFRILMCFPRLSFQNTVWWISSNLSIEQSCPLFLYYANLFLDLKDGCLGAVFLTGNFLVLKPIHQWSAYTFIATEWHIWYLCHRLYIRKQSVRPLYKTPPVVNTNAWCCLIVPCLWGVCCSQRLPVYGLFLFICLFSSPYCNST